MVKLVFWNYLNLYKNGNKPSIIIEELDNYSFTLEELLRRNNLNIKILKVYKNSPKFLYDENNPYWDLKKTKLIDYFNYYDIRSPSCDFVFTYTTIHKFI